jgi:hypothetical protein
MSTLSDLSDLVAKYLELPAFYTTEETFQSTGVTFVAGLAGWLAFGNDTKERTSYRLLAVFVFLASGGLYWFVLYPMAQAFWWQTICRAAFAAAIGFLVKRPGGGAEEGGPAP